MKSEERKQQILEAAMTCFTQEGFHQTSMDDIARKAGISTALIYRHFKCKEDLIASLTSLNTQGRQWFLYELLQFPTIGQSLEFFFEIMLQSPDWGNSVPLLAQISAEAFRNPRVAEILRKDNAIFFGAFAHLIRQAQSRGQVDPSLNAEDTAYMLISFTNGLISQMALDNAWRKFADPSYIRLFKQMFTCFLKIDSPYGTKREDS